MTFNGLRLLPRTSLQTFEATLPTVVADEDGIMRLRARKTQVGIYEALPGEVPSLYEMGLPVVETGDKWHVNVGQKVPVNRDRDNVRPAYLQAVRVAVMNAAHDLLTTEEEATAGWCKLAGADRRCTDEAIKHLIQLRFGTKVATSDPNDPEAVKRFQSQGGTIVVGLSKGEWANVRRAGTVLPAGKICPTAKAYGSDPNAKSADVIPEKDWTEGMKKIASYARFLAEELMGQKVVVFDGPHPQRLHCLLWEGCLDFNLFHLGHKWFEQGVTEAVDQLLLHEFGHQYSGDHLSEEYHEALCRLGQASKRLAMTKPEEIRHFMR